MVNSPYDMVRELDKYQSEFSRRHEPFPQLAKGSLELITDSSNLTRSSLLNIQNIENKRDNKWIAVLLTAILCPSISYSEQDTPAVNPSTVVSNDTGWRLSITPTFWLPPVEGEQHKQGFVVDFESSQSERIDRFHTSGELFIELRNGQWTLVVQPQYSEVELDGTLNTPLGAVPMDIYAETLLVEYWVGRRQGSEEHWLEFLVGGRHVELDASAESALGPDQSRFDWHDVMVGARAGSQIVGPISIEALVTASGFDLSKNSSKRTYEARGALNIDISPRVALQTGYRYFDTEYFENEATPVPSLIRYKLSGPFVSFTAKVK